MKDCSHLVCKIIVLVGLAFCFACTEVDVSRKTTEVVNPDQQEDLNQYEEKQLFLRVNEPFQGDLSAIRGRRLIRVLVNYSKTNFFIDGGVARGFEYELLQQYEKFLNKSISDKYHQVKMVFILVPFDQLLVALQDGRGDIAAAGLTITAKREKYVQFTDPYIPDVREIVVVNSKHSGIGSLDDLSGKRLYVLNGSSFVTHLEKLNKRFLKQGKLPIQVEESDSNLVAEDMLELLNAGVLERTVADQREDSTQGVDP